MKGKARRLLSWVCVLALCMSLLPVTALAVEQNVPTEGNSESYVQNGTPTTKDEVTVSKTAKWTEQNAYEITLSVTVPGNVTIPGQSTDVVLVIDASSSMSGGNIQAARKAAKSFAQKLLAEDISADVNLAVVTYTERPSIACNLTDELKTVTDAIDGINIRNNQGTNIQAGVYQARQLLKDSKASNQVIVLLSDGEPTYSYPVQGTCGIEHKSFIVTWHESKNVELPRQNAVTEENFDYTETTGNGNSYSGVNAIVSGYCDNCKEKVSLDYDGDEKPYNNNGDPAIAEAGFAKTAGCEIYSLYLGDPSEEATHTMKGIATDVAHYKQANQNSLSDLLKQIAGDVTSTTAGAVTDPMGENIVLGDVSDLEDAGVTATDNVLTWDPTQSQGTKNEDGSTTYTVTYPITVDTSSLTSSGAWFEANGRTTFTYKVNGQEKTIDFEVPNVWGENPVKENNVFIKVYLNGQDVTSDQWETFLPGLTTTGTTEAQGELTFDASTGSIKVPYTYVDIDAADVQFGIANGYVLQGVQGTFVYGQRGWNEVKADSGTWTVDNVDGDTTLSVYLNTAYSVEYTVPVGVNPIVDSKTYISAEEIGQASSPNFGDITSDSPVDVRNQGYSGSWKNDSLNTQIVVADLPEHTTGWTNEAGSTTEGSSNLTVQEALTGHLNGDDSVFTFTAATATYTVTYTDGVKDEEVFKDQVIDNLTFGSATPDFNGKPERTGYTFTGWNPEVAETVSGDVTYTAQWTKDENATKDLSYTVEYYKDGVKVDDDTQTVKQTVWVNDPDTLTVDKDAINTTDKYSGYKFDSSDPKEIPESISNGSTIKVYYVKDESATKDLSYTVEYYKDGVKVDGDTQTVEQTVWVNDPDTLTVNKDAINTIDKYEGYTLDGTDPVTIPDTIQNNGVIKVYYATDNNGDQIPDKYQVTIEYKAAEGGSIAEDALTKEVKTIYAADGKTYAESGTVTATGSTATADEGYFFNKWTKAVNEGNAEDTSLSAATGFINLGTVSGGDVITFTAYFTEENPKVNITKELTSVTRDGQQIGDLTAYTAQVGDELTYTITVINNGNITLETVTVEDKFTGSGTLTFNTPENVEVEGTTLTISDLSNEEGSNSVSITATYTVQPDDISKNTIVNTANAYIGEEGGDPDDTAEETVHMDDYTVTITPANITIYTGGDGYGGVTNESGAIIDGTEASGLPEPGYHIDLPDAVVNWLAEQGIDASGSNADDVAADLSQYLTFTYNHDDQTRDWSMGYAGIYSTNETTGEPTRYVYTLNPAKVEDKEIPVRLLYKNGETVVSTDDILMSETLVSDQFSMTINPGELTQSQIRAKLTVEGQSISCNIDIQPGTLTVRSTTDKDTTTEIVNEQGDVTSNTITAVDGGEVQYYVNNSEVTVDANRVQLLVDEVSNGEEFNAAMGADAIAKAGVDRENAAYDLAYMDLVDTQNGNAVVTMGDNQSLFIYWPVPENAAADSEFHVVHYTGMDREGTVDIDKLEEQRADVKTGADAVEKVTIGDQQYVKFTTDSFSPFALVYEKAPDPVAKLEVTKTLTKVNDQPYTGGSVSVNDTLTYTITVKNGEVALNNVTITDTFNGKGDLNFTLPNGATVSENPAGTYTINLGNLTAGQEVTITATYKVLRGDANGTLTNAVSVTGTPTDGGEPTTGGDTETTPVNPYRPPIRPPEDPDKPELNTEDHYAYIVGYEDGSVQPEGDITRAEVATIFFRLLTDESRNEYWSQTNPYSDVSADDWFNNAVSTLTNAGVLDGYEDGTFKPNGNITRAEFATITARFFEATYDGENLFPDIEGHWAQDYINEAANAGIVNGYEDGTFRPQQYITRAEAVTMVNRTIERHPDADHLLDDMITWPDNPETAWYYEQIQEATNSHEYTMNTDDEQNPYEIWTKLLPNRDWSELEKEWSDANDGAGSGEVV